MVGHRSGLEAGGLRMNAGWAGVMFCCGVRIGVGGSVWRGFSLGLKGGVCAACVGSCLVPGNRTLI